MMCNTTKSSREEEEYSLVFPKTPKVYYSPKSGKTFMLVCSTVKKTKHA